MRLRILFIGLLLLLPLEAGLTKILGDEPYPALMMPGFGQVMEKGSAVEFYQSEIIGVLADGQTVPLAANAIMANPIGYSVAFQTILSDPVRSKAEVTRTWLRERLASAYPDLEIARLTVNKNLYHYDEATDQRTVTTTESFDIVLGDPS
jgi:hypothetical protein